MRFEGVGRGKGNENIVVNHASKGGVKQDIRSIFLRNFFNFDFVEFILPATRTSLISVEQSSYSPWTDEPSNLEDSFKDTLRMQHTPKAKNLNRSEFQYFVLQQKSEKINRISNVKNIYLHNNNDEKVLRNR